MKLQAVQFITLEHLGPTCAIKCYARVTARWNHLISLGLSNLSLNDQLYIILSISVNYCLMTMFLKICAE